MENNIDKVIDEILNKKENFEETINVKEIKERLYKLEEENKKLKNIIEYNDSNLKANYISILLGMLFFTMSYVFDFALYLKISNLTSSMIFITLISLFFFKENNIIIKKIFKLFV